MEEMRIAYSSVDTYDDLLNRNIDYLDSKLQANPYTHEGITDEIDMIPLLPKLKDLTRLGYYSITGQPNKAIYNKYDDNKKLFVSIEQRNYTSGLLEDGIARHLKTFLDNCKYKNDIYYRIDFDNELGYYVESNMPYNSNNYFNLARHYETQNNHDNDKKKYDLWIEHCNCWNDVNHRRNIFYQYKDFPKIMQIFLKCAGVYICTKQYNSKISVEDIMKEFLLSKENTKYNNALAIMNANEPSIDELMKQFSLDDDENNNNNNNNNNNQKNKKNKKNKKK